MRFAVVLLVLFLSSLLSVTHAQDYKTIDSLIAKADSFYLAKNYDSSLVCSLRTIKWLEGRTPDEYELNQGARAMLNAGLCYLKKNNVQNAHRFFNYSLRQSRALGLKGGIENAFVELNNLHRYISINDLSFAYPEVAVTEEVAMYFPISKVERVGNDSIRVTIRAGRYDGIADSVKKGGAVSHYIDKDTPRPFGLVNCYIRELTNNYCIAMAIYDTARKVLVGDLVELKTRAPAYWRSLNIDQALIDAIYFTDNYRQPIFNSRYLYYYSDSLTNNTITSIMKSSVDEIADMLAADTANYKEKGEKGIFAGENVIKAMSRSTEEHLRLFMGFVYEYPGKYIGNPFKFAEVYATWIISNTPLALADVRPYLATRSTTAERRQMAAKLSADIKKPDLISRWFDEGMQMANADKIDSAIIVAEVIRDASISLSDNFNKGWGTYLSGYVEKKLGNFGRADSLFRSALIEFRSGKNTEGEAWINSALASLKKSRSIELSVQTGHLFSYIIAPSPNSKYLATAGNYDKYIKIWDLSLMREVASFNAHSDYINSLNYSPNGRYIVSSSDDNTIRIWNAYDYSLLRTFKTIKPETRVIFTPDSKQLVAGGVDSTVKFLDLNTGAVLNSFKKHKGTITGLAFLPGNERFLFSSATDSMVYKWDMETNDWDHRWKETGEIINLSISNNGKWLCTVGTDTLIQVRNLETNFAYFTTRPHYSSDANTDFAIPAFTPDSKYLAYAFRGDTLATIEIATLKERAYPFKLEGRQGLYDLVFTPDGNFLAGRIDQGGPLRVFNFSGWDMNNRPTINFNDFKNYYNLPLEVQFSRDDNKLFVVHEGISSIDLRNGSTTPLYYGALWFQNNHILLNDEKIGLYTDTKLAYLKFYDYENKNTTLEIHLPDLKEEMSRFELSANNKYVFLGGKNITVAGFELPSGKMLFSNRYLTDGEKEFHSIRYDSIRQKLYIIGKTDKVVVADARKGNITGTIIAKNPHTIEVGPRYVYITCANSEVYKYDAITLKLLKRIKVHTSGKECYGSVMSADYRFLVVQVADKFVTIDTRTDKVLYERYDHDYENGVVTISHNNKLLASGGFDCKVNLYELATGKKIATIYTPREKDFMIADNEGHYLAPKNTLEAIGFNYNNSSYGFEQFDTRFNRPDLLLKTLGRADTGLIRSFHAAYLKRLKKLNISEKDMGSDLHLPVVRLKDRFALKPATSLSEYAMEIQCFDAKYPLHSVQVMVNNNPLFGTAGKSIPAGQYNFNLTVQVPLSTGINLVKVYCTNNKGAISLAESLEISSTTKPLKTPKTYFFGIAVSRYKDSTMNLRFATKDVSDLAAMFGRIQNNYEADTLIDEMATKENILKLREKLMQTTVDDKVIISVNGHGMLDGNKDFYFGTYDIDFKDPAGRGLKYEDLEALLDGIPARKKLILIDACHSGALDKDELIARQKKDTIIVNKSVADTGIVKGITVRGTVIQSSSTTVDANSSYELMQSLFADLSAGNGAVIISAAGGMEYAFESDSWNNGVFTYCVRKGIEEELADKEGGDSNHFVEVSELKNYVSKKVSELTNGRQRPVSRRENVVFDWAVW